MKKIYDEIYTAALDFQTKLNILKKVCNDKDAFADTLLDCNSLYNRFESLYKINTTKQPESKLQIIEKSQNLVVKEFTNGDFTCKVIVHDDFGLISVETGNFYLNEVLFKALVNNLDNANKILNMFADYSHRICDICGLYGLNGADIRQVEADYISAYHSTCLECNNMQ